ncbi:MAG: hypothetical protein E4H27_05520 [Anaerolineales bacterium]|nr:MAG: hypothetical protein E4H27_05520 [Anaerolineales bacterium]
MTSPTDPGTETPETPEAIRHQVRVEYRIYLVIVAVVSLIVGGIMGIYLFRGGREAIRVETVQQALSPELDIASMTSVPPTNDLDVVISVYVSGAVNSAEVVTLAQGSLVMDAIAAVGGASPDANLDAINLASPLRDHEHILVPKIAETGAVQSVAVLLNINTATVTELETLPYIGPSRAQQIVTYRESNGSYQNKEDIMQVPGIGTVIYEEIAPFITVDVN